MYSFTDKFIAEELISLANRGVHIRIYRDHQQFADEQSRGNSTTDMLHGIPNIEIRVKRSRTLMHLKAFCVDDDLLRIGSANWSAAGLKRQDNNARYIDDPAEVQGFERNFEVIWSRDNNEVIQGNYPLSVGRRDRLWKWAKSRRIKGAIQIGRQALNHFWGSSSIPGGWA